MDLKAQPQEQLGPPQNEYIFDDLAKLQSQYKRESNLQEMFGTLFETKIEQNNKRSITEFVKKQMVMRNEWDLFKYQVEDENLQAEQQRIQRLMTECVKAGDEKTREELCHQLDNMQVQKGKNKKPSIRVLNEAPEKQFTMDGIRSISTLFFNLWGDNNTE